jgi:hypothetical protein
MQKHKFGVTCLGTLFMETAPGPPEHEQYCVNVSRPGRTNALHNSQITPDAKTQVQHIVS